MILSPGLWAFAFCALQTTIFIAISVVFGLDIAHADPLTVAVFLLLTVACISPLGVLAASMTMVFKKSGPVEFLFNNAALVCGGIFLPVEKLPHALQMVSWLLPITHALRGLRAGFRGAPIATLTGDVRLAVRRGRHLDPDLARDLRTSRAHRAHRRHLRHLLARHRDHVVRPLFLPRPGRKTQSLAHSDTYHEAVERLAR